MTFEQGIDMVTALLQTLSALFLVYGAYLAFVFAFGKDAPRPQVSAGPARGLQPRLGEGA